MDLIEQKWVKSENFTRHPWEQARLKIVFHFLQKIANAKFILDFGSGDAYISSHLANKCPNATIIAADIHYTAQTCSSINHPPNLHFVRNLAALNNIRQKCDLVLMLDVLEHIAEPDETLKELLAYSCITPVTNFLITVPAYQTLFNDHDGQLGHYKRYNRRELVQLLNKNGLKIKTSGYFFLSLLPIRLFEKISKVHLSPNQVTRWRGSKLLTFIISNTLWLDFKFSYFLSRFKIYLPGLTCFCLCCPTRS